MPTSRRLSRLCLRDALLWTQSGTCAPAQKAAMLRSDSTFGLVMSLMMVSTAEKAMARSESSSTSSSRRTRTSVSVTVLPVTTTSGRGTHPASLLSDSRCILTPSPSTTCRPTVASRFQRVGGFRVSSSLELATIHRDASWVGSKVPSVSSSSLKFPRTFLSCSFIVSIRNSAALSPGKRICSRYPCPILNPPPTVAAPPAASSRVLICAACASLSLLTTGALPPIASIAFLSVSSWLRSFATFLTSASSFGKAAFEGSIGASVMFFDAKVMIVSLSSRRSGFLASSSIDRNDLLSHGNFARSRPSSSSLVTPSSPTQVLAAGSAAAGSAAFGLTASPDIEKRLDS
mmetsp:Transcript_44122/g.147155  ORF Transcript_44122/g.147155 Transcript_44122/m.147155 type:complete len:346 (-) Transcript_44122:20-1057(-)